MAHSGLPTFEIHVKRTAAVPLNSIEIHWIKKLFRNGETEKGVNVMLKNECLFYKQKELASIGNESHPF